MSTGINIAPSSDLTVGTTAVTSGTDTRVFFQAGGVVQQDANFTFDNTLKRLTLKAVGTAATDIPIIVQDSAAANNLFEFRGNGQLYNINNTSGVSAVSTLTTTDNLSAPALRVISTGGNSSATIAATRLAGSGVSATATNRGFVYLESLGGNHCVIGANDGIAFSSQGISAYNPTSDQMRLKNGNLAIGTGYSASARLDVKAQGALSTDIAFRVRNSADTQNLISIAGNGTTTLSNSMLEVEANDVTGIGYTRIRKITVGTFNKGSQISLFKNDNTNNIEIIRLEALSEGGITLFPEVAGTKSVTIGNIVTGNNGGVSMYSTGVGTHNIQIANQFHNIFQVQGAGAQATFRVGNAGSNVNFFNVHGNNAGSLTTNPIFTINSNGNFANGVTTFGTNAQFVFAHGNGTSPTTSPADAYQQYSADITAGNAAPHFRTENGAIVKVYQETTAVAAATLVGNAGTTITDTDTFDGYTLKQIVKALRNQGLLA